MGDIMDSTAMQQSPMTSPREGLQMGFGSQPSSPQVSSMGDSVVSFPCDSILQERPPPTPLFVDTVFSQTQSASRQQERQSKIESMIDRRKACFAYLKASFAGPADAYWLNCTLLRKQPDLAGCVRVL